MIDVNIKNQLVSRTAKVLMFIDENKGINIKEISKALDIDYNFVSKIVVRCEEHGLIKSEIVSRDKKVELDKKGKKLSELIKQIERVMK